MRLAFTPLAEQDLEAIADYIAANNPMRALTLPMTAKTKSRILEAVHESASDLHRLGCIDKREKQEYDLPCLETPALLKVLALGEEDVEAGRVKPVTDVVARLRAKRADA